MQSDATTMTPSIDHRTCDHQGLLPYLRCLLFGRKNEETDGKRTDLFNARLGMLGLVMLVAMGSYGVFGIRTGQRLSFFVWGLTAAFCAYLIGILLGLLFGLPSTRTWSARQSATSQAPNTPNGQTLPAAAANNTVAPSADANAKPVGSSLREPDLPYDENTSLEQIADWLTKIIVGVGLTQFSTWRIYFNEMAFALAQQMLGSTPANTNSIAGGLVLIGFGTLGFLMSYMWMRRYFILEMVVARRSALVTMATRAEAVQAQAAADTKEARNREAEAALQAERLKVEAAQAEIARMGEEARLKDETIGRQLEQLKQQGAAVQSQPGSKISREEVEKQLAVLNEQLPPKTLESFETNSGVARSLDDPWKGLFGGQSSRDGFKLSGQITPFSNDPTRFAITISVACETLDAREKVAGRFSARFFLHPTFDPSTVSVAFSTDGIAQLKVVAYGTFTVGVVVENGPDLELNLSSLEDAKNYPVFLTN